MNDSDRFSRQAIQQEQSTQSSAANSRRNHTRGGDLNPGDRFSASSDRSSGSSTPNTGIYSVREVDLFSVVARVVSSQAGTAPALQPAASPGADSSTSAPAAIVGGPVLSAGSPPSSSLPQPADIAGSGATGVGATPPNGSTAAAGQDPLQPLNDALSSLGLSNQEIQTLDQVANFIKGFNPTAFSDLVGQFQQLAQQTTQVATAPVNSQDAANGAISGNAATPATGAISPTAANTPPTNNVSTGGLQIQEFTIRFSGVDVQRSAANSTNGAQGGHGARNANAGGSFQSSAFSLQIEEVNILLTGDNGQVAQVQTPQPPVTAPSPAANPSPALSTAAAA